MSTWKMIHDYIVRRDPSFEQSRTPIDVEVIETVQESCGVTFPSVYVDFLVAAGESSGAYHPFDEIHCANFFDIVERISKGTLFALEAYWPVGLKYDPRAEFDDPFIDLTRIEGGDAPLVMFDGRHEVWAGNPAVDSEYTLSEELARNAFCAFEESRRAHSTLLVLSPESSRAFEDVLEYLQLMEMMEVLAPTPRFRVFDRADTLGVSVHLGLRTIGITIAGNELRDCWEVVDVIRRNIENADGGLSEVDLA